MGRKSDFKHIWQWPLTQDERGMNRLRINAQIFFCEGMFILGLFIISIVKWFQIPFNLTDMG